jgi:RimJ/RimL family protein N-acetyltransferase
VISHGAREVGQGDVRLREVRPDDAQRLYAWRMDERSRPMFRSTAEVPFATHRQFMERYFREGNTDRWFVIEAEGEPVGTITLYGFSPDGREAEWGRLVVDPALRGRGYARRALALVIEHARALGVKTLRCEVLEGNDVAAGLYRQAGFLPAGLEEAAGRRFLQLTLDLEG